MKPLSRRSVTAGLAAAVTAIPAVGFCTGVKDGSELRELIKAHRSAYRAFCNAIDRHNASTEDANNKGELIVPCLLGGGVSLGQGHDLCREHILGAYSSQRDRLKPLARVRPNWQSKCEPS